MIGTRLGPYEITAKLGEGGMGEVWRATDTRLLRDVALKVLRADLTADVAKLARFEREAQLLAQLHHPNIAALFGFEESDGVRALVLELVEGPTLANRLESGALSFDESLQVAVQIAHALEEAHAKGIVHRDLKPQNIKVSAAGEVKVLDFGLAKVTEPSSASSSGVNLPLALSPTVTLGSTIPGRVMGTAAYMAPEQARGLAIDKRIDVWAFGVVLYEMLTGRAAFLGATLSDTLAAVLTREVDMAALPSHVPLAIRQLLRRCLERNPKNRLHDVADARIVLEELIENPDVDARAIELAAASQRRSRWPWAIAALSLLAAAVAGLATLRNAGAEPTAASLQRSSILLSAPAYPKLRPNPVPGTFALAPDGSAIVFAASEGGAGTFDTSFDMANDRLWLRELASLEVRPLEGSEGARFPFWSPDSRQIAFFTPGLLRRVPRTGGGVQTVCRATNGRGGAWSEEGTILFADSPYSALLRVAAGGGTPVEATRFDRAKGESSHRFPVFLPGGRNFLFGVEPWLDGFRLQVKVGSLDEVGTGRALLEAGSVPRFAAPHELVFSREEALIAQSIDLDRLEMTGEPRLLADRPQIEGLVSSVPAVDLGGAGKLLFAPVDPRPTRFVWLDRDGVARAVAMESEGRFSMPALSRKGDRLAAIRFLPGNGRQLWAFDLARGTGARVTSPNVHAEQTAWSGDDREIATLLSAQGPASMNSVSLVDPDSGAARALIGPSDRWIAPQELSADGRLLLFAEMTQERSRDLGILDLGGGGERTYLSTAADEGDAALSHDGRWIAYRSNASGQFEIYVDTFPTPTAAWRVVASTDVSKVWWGADGRELAFVARAAGETAVFASAVRRDAGSARGIEIERPRRLFGLRGEARGLAPSADGQRFLLLEPVGDLPRSLTLVDGWATQLERGGRR